MFTTLGCTTYAVWGQELCDYVRVRVDQRDTFVCIFVGMKAISRKRVRPIYKNGGKTGDPKKDGKKKDLDVISKWIEAEKSNPDFPSRLLDRRGFTFEDVKKFYETGVNDTGPEGISTIGGKNMTAEEIREGLKFAMDRILRHRFFENPSGKLTPQDQVTYDYFDDLLKLSDEDLPRSYRGMFNMPAQFFDTSDMDKLQPRGAGSMSTDDLDKELQESGASIADNSRRREPRLIYKSSNKTRTGQEPDYYVYYDSKGNPKRRPVEPEERDRYIKENRIRNPQIIRASF